MTNLLITAQLTIFEAIDRLMNREEGQDMIEYALLAALISIVAIGTIVLLGPKITGIFNSVVNGLQNA